ncbi:prepilin peptidase [Haloferula sp.]|uniref:prepilin peptidase n=1 Tax=Haloferula sp. TaxID=2497595 RepID=UPI00329EA60D
MIYPPLDHPVWLVPAFLIGACIGSFLNVVIYRLPLGLSVNDPKRSFCPKCKYEIPMRQNIPLFSWLSLRGKCSSCKAPIASRYFIVELVTAILFALVGWAVIQHTGGKEFCIEQLALLPLWFMTASFVAIAFIDAEHLIIPLELTISGTVAGFIAAALMPILPDLVAWASPDPNWLGGLYQALIGWVIGFFGLWAVVLLGKLAFGRKELKFEEPVSWHLEEPKTEEETIIFHMGDEKIEWWDIFFRKSDKLIIEADSAKLNGDEVGGGNLVLRENGIELPDGKKVDLEDVKSLEGTSASAVIPREAMGMGDVHLMGVIGAFFGWSGVFFTLLASSLYAIAGAVLGRIGFGMRLPFGPFLVLGALTWLLGGWKLAEWYFDALR